MTTAPVSPTTTSSTAPLRRSVGAPLLLLFLLGDVLGAGIYALVGAIAAESGGAVWLPMLVALGLALLTAASYAELVTKYPRAGGSAVFVQRAFGRPLLSFLAGFAMVAAGLVSVAALALAFAGDYLGELVDLPRVPVAAALVVVLAALNAHGIRDSLRANFVMTAVELTGLLLVIVLAVAVVSGGDGNPGRALDLRDGASPWAAVLGAALLAFYAFVGFETTANLAEETVDPSRVYPRVLFAGLLIAGAVYCLVGLAVTMAVPTDVLAGSDGPLLEVVRRAPGGLPPELFSVIALIAVANGALLTSIMASRLTFGMAREGLLPPVLGRVLPSRGTPVVAIAFTALLILVLIATGEFEQLAATVVLLLLFVFICVNLAALALRRTDSDSPHFRAPVWAPVGGVLSCLVLATQQRDAATWVTAGLVLLVGLVLYGVTRLTGAPSAAARS